MSPEAAGAKAGAEPITAPTAARADQRAGPRWLVDVLAAGLGVGASRLRATPAIPTDTGTALAHERTGLAMERTHWAAERTLMGWIRTTLSMISFGFTIGKIGQALPAIEVKTFLGVSEVGVQGIAYFLVILGTGALLAATAQYALRAHALCERGLNRQPSIAFPVAIVLTLIGGFALTALVLKL